MHRSAPNSASAWARNGSAASTPVGPLTISVISPDSLQTTLGWPASSAICCRHCDGSAPIRGLPTWSSTNWTSGVRRTSSIASSSCELRTPMSKVSSRSASSATPSRKRSATAKPGFSSWISRRTPTTEGMLRRASRSSRRLRASLQRRERDDAAHPRQLTRLLEQPLDLGQALSVGAVALHDDEVGHRPRRREQGRGIDQPVQLGAVQPGVTQPAGIPEVHVGVDDSHRLRCQTSVNGAHCSPSGVPGSRS